MAANTSNSESNFTGFQFWALYVTPMPYPGATGSSFFEGANINKFLERLENISDD